MSPEEKEIKALGRRIVDALNAGNLTAIDEVFASSYVEGTRSLASLRTVRASRRA